MNRRLRSVIVAAALVLVSAPPAAAQDDDSGALEWVITVPSTFRSGTTPRGFAVDPSAGVIVAVLNVEGSTVMPDGTELETGAYAVWVDFDGQILRTVPLRDRVRRMDFAANGDLLTVSEQGIARLSGDGVERWRRELPGIFEPGIVELTDGNIAVVGRVFDPVTLGAGESTETAVGKSPDGTTSGFVAWFGPEGSFLSADPWFAAGDIDVAAAPGGVTRVVSDMSTELTLGAGQAGEVTVAPTVADGEDRPPSTAVLASYAPAGQLEWAVNTQAAHSGDVIDLAVSEDGSTVIWQSIDTASTLGAGGNNEVRVLPLRAEGEFGDDHLLHRYGPDGTFEWAHVMGSPTYTEEEYRSLHVRPDGGISVTGTLAAGMTTIGGSAGLLLDVGETARHFVAVFDPDGSFRWATAFGGDSFDAGWGSALLDDGDVIVFGVTGGTASHGFPGSETLISDVDGNWLVARFDGLEPVREPPPTTEAPTTTTPATTAATPDAVGDVDDSIDTPAQSEIPGEESDAGSPVVIYIVALAAILILSVGFVVRGRMGKPLTS